MEQDFSEVGDDDAVEQVLDPDWLDAELDRDLLELEPLSLPDLQFTCLKINIKTFITFSHNTEHNLLNVSVLVLILQRGPGLTLVVQYNKLQYKCRAWPKCTSN